MVEYNQIGNIGAAAIANVIQENNAITDLDLSIFYYFNRL